MSATASSASLPRATDRGLSLLVQVADHPEGLPLAELARRVELSNSTALRQLRALEAAGFARRRDDGNWGPGPTLLRIARDLSRQATLPNLAAPILAELAADLGESAYLAERDGERAVYVAMQAGTHAVRHVSWLGESVPLHGTAVGAALRGQVDDDGVSVREDAVEPGVVATAAPIVDAQGRVVAALSVVGPSYRITGELLTTVRRLVSAQAQILSARS